MDKGLVTFVSTFLLIFVAEVGDKTQIAVMAQVAAGRSPWAVGLGAAAALVVSTALGVVAGVLLARWLNPTFLHYASATIFLLFGVVLFVRGPGGAT